MSPTSPPPFPGFAWRSQHAANAHWRPADLPRPSFPSPLAAEGRGTIYQIWQSKIANRLATLSSD